MKDKNIDEFWSFDLGNVQSYDLYYNPTFYSEHMRKETCDSTLIYDVVYIGRNKSRKTYVTSIEEVLKSCELKYLFFVVDNEKDYVNYYDYIKIVNKSKCILDITQDGQQGLTMRFMESLFLNKKIITNNKRIVSYDFYNPDNIFIIGYDDYRELKSFLASPYIPVQKSIIDRYDVKEWSKRFWRKNAT